MSEEEVFVATSLVSLETMGFGKQGIALKHRLYFGQLLDVTEMVIVQVESEGGLALSFG